MVIIHPAVSGKGWTPAPCDAVLPVQCSHWIESSTSQRKDMSSPTWAPTLGPLSESFVVPVILGHSWQWLWSGERPTPFSGPLSFLSYKNKACLWKWPNNAEIYIGQKNVTVFSTPSCDCLWVITIGLLYSFRLRKCALAGLHVILCRYVHIHFILTKLPVFLKGNKPWRKTHKQHSSILSRYWHCNVRVKASNRISRFLIF